MNSDAQKAITDWLTLLGRVTRGQMPEGYTYAGIGEFLLLHGTWYEPRPLPKRMRRGIPRGCFSNALKLARTGKYRFVEGYAVADGCAFLPIHHAWNLDGVGNLIDNTWQETGLAYLGVEFPLEVAEKAIRYQGNTVLDNPKTRHEIYREPYAQTVIYP
jgi:hypothetical protein